MKTLICTSCHASIANDDWAWLDMYADTPEESEEIYNRVTASAQALEYEYDADTHAPAGYWNCFVCDSTYCGATGHEQAVKS